MNDTLIEPGNETVIGDAGVDQQRQRDGGFPEHATVTIADNDTTTVSIGATDAAASETPTNPGQFTVSLGAAAEYDVQVSYTVGGTAAGTTDYTALAGTVTILATQTTATIDVSGIVNDTLIERAMRR